MKRNAFPPRLWLTSLALLSLVACTTGLSAPPPPAAGGGPEAPAAEREAPASEAPEADSGPPADPGAPADSEPPASDLAEAKPTDDSEIPLDPSVSYGQLANGLTYYVRQNAKPENRAELRLVVNAGSLVEDDDQLGLAHFVEHMAFNGTENFAKQELIDYLEGIGMRFGPDINAYTSFDETVYMLEVPTDDSEILSTGLQILEEWAHRVSFEGEEIDKERGVVVEEWRLGRGAWGRIRDQQLPVTFHGSRYAERLVIGDKEILEAAPYEALRRFYRDWYRPDLMAVIAIGDFEPAEIAEEIRSRFSQIEMPSETRERLDYPIPGHQETLTSIVTDPEATTINVSVGYKRPPTSNRTLADLRDSLVDDLYDSMLSRRLDELRLQADPPFQFAYAGSGRLGRTKSMYNLYTVVRDGGVVRGLQALLTEARRVEEHGFVPGELERAKTSWLRSIERAWEERDKRESSRFASEYIRHFLVGEPSPGIEYERPLLEKMLPGIALEEINARAAQWITEDNRIILVSGPDKVEAGIPEERALLATFDEVDQVAVTPWVDRTRDEPLVATAPTPGKVISEETIEEVGTTRWTLSNGIVVLLKPTDFKNDEILIRGYSPGGHSLVSDEDYLSATQAASIIGQMGLGSFDRVELRKKLTGKVAGVGAYVSELSEGISGSASPKDLETLFELLYLRFVGVRRDEEAFQSHLTTTRGWLENQEASPGYQFNVKFNEVAYQNHPRRQPLTMDKLDQVDLDRAMAVYQDRFADASDFLFTVVGSFELETMRPLVETWLASLPRLGREETWRDVDALAAPGVQKLEVRRGIEPKSQVRLTIHGDAEWSPLQQHIAGSLGEALRIRLREVLREDLGGVYGVGVAGRLYEEPRQRINFIVSFSCDPERVDELLAAAFAELEAMKADGPSQELIDKVQAAQRRSRETALEQNRFWLSQLEYHERHGFPLTDILDYDEMVAAVTRESLHAAAQSYLNFDNYILGVLYPEDLGEGP